jgi:hypothetical protein
MDEITRQLISNISIAVIILCIPPIMYLLYRIAHNKRKVKVHANWESIQKHISLDDLEKKASEWSEKGYDVSDIETMLGEKRHQK